MLGVIILYNNTMTKQDISEKVRHMAEGSNVELKTCSGGRLPKDIGEAVSAFSNTDGGQIILGVTSDGQITKLNPREIDQLQLDLASLCTSAFNIIIMPEIIHTDGVLIAEIPPAVAPVRPVYIKNKGMNKGTYVRIGSSNRLANDEWLRRFSVAARGGAEIITYPDSIYEELFDLARVDEFITMLNTAKNNIYQNFNRREVLIKQKAINSNGEITLFGLLAFGKGQTPQEIISPTVNIAITQYPGSTKVNEDDLNETYLDNREFGGNVVEQFEQAFAFIKTKLPIRGTIDEGGKRRDYFIIPEVALRESLANAIAHRDYSVHSSRIQIDIFSDRLEIINPGTSLVPISELDTAPSSSRNPLLMSYLKEHGITDQKARGIRTIKSSIKNAGLIEPVFENISSSFKVTLSGLAFISHDDKVWLRNFNHFKLNDRQLNGLAHVRNNESGISNGEYRDINSMNSVRDDKKANKELRHLTSLGILRTEGENKARRYILSDKYR